MLRPIAPETSHLDARTRAYARAIALRMVRDEHAADDVAQDAMLLAHRHRASFRGQARFSTWMYRVTTTAALMYLRRQRRWAREVTRLNPRMAVPDVDEIANAIPIGSQADADGRR